MMASPVPVLPISSFSFTSSSPLPILPLSAHPTPPSFLPLHSLFILIFLLLLLLLLVLLVLLLVLLVLLVLLGVLQHQPPSLFVSLALFHNFPIPFLLVFRLTFAFI